MKRLAFLAALLVGFALAPCSHAARTNAVVKIEKPGVPNLYRVSDRLYRSAQPSAEGFRELEKMGIKTVLSLRSFHSDTKLVSAPGDLKQERIRFNTWNAEVEDVVRFLKVISNTNSGPVLVHCYHGADRTGTMIAIYRIVMEGWTKEEAIAEMTGKNFGYHKIWLNLVPFIKKLNVDAIKKKAGIAPAP